MPLHNQEIAEKLSKTADLLELHGENIFRVRAYRNAASTMESLSKNVVQLLSEGKDLSDYSGIGEDLAGKISQIADTGSFDLLDELKNEIPEDVTKMMGIAGLGAKRVGKIYNQLNITSIEKLKEAIESGQLAQLEGFGKKTGQNIYDEITRMEKDQPKRFELPLVTEIAEDLINYLEKAQGVKKLDIAGSYRRKKETVKDLDILATCSKGSNIMDHFTGYEDVKKVISKGKTRSSVVLESNINVDLRVMEQVSYGAAMVYFTGSKDHNIALRKICNKRNLKLNEYGIFAGDKRIAGKTESEVYKTLDLRYIEPELRENRGELDAAREGKLPRLITQKDIKGDLHIHTKYTDGDHSIKEMAQAAQSMGYEYVAITDHTKHLTFVGGLYPKDLRKQFEEIDKINAELDITILKGSEIDILEDGTLDLPDEILKELDIRVCSIHHKFDLPKKKQTERIIRAMGNPYFDILGHPTGRTINGRPPYELDIEKIIKTAKSRGCMVELNSHPERLDLNDIYCKMAKSIGTKVVISTDSHQTDNLISIRFGIGQARRGWLEAKDVANTKSLKQLKKLLKK